MSLTAIIEDEIRRLYAELGTQQAVADKLGVTRQFIQQLLTGKAKCANVTAAMIDKMFPQLKVKLRTGSIINTGTAVNAPQTIHNYALGDSVHEALYELLGRIMASEKLSDNAKIILYQLVNDFETKKSKRTL